MTIQTIFALGSMVALFFGFYYYRKLDAWHKYCLPVEKDKHWHYEAALLGTIYGLSAQVLYGLWWWVVPVVAIGVSIGKEFYDATHGTFFDVNDLKADGLGILTAYVIFYWIGYIT